MKKIIFILVALLATTFTSYAQDRVNGVNYNFNSYSKQVTNIVGWCFNYNEEKWIDNSNFIFLEKKPSYYNDKRLSCGVNSVQVRTFQYNEKLHYVLIISFNSGRYRYPSIQEDWYDFVEYKVYHLTKEEYDFIVNPTEYRCFDIPCVKYHNYYGDYNNNRVIREVIANNKYSMGGFAITKYKNVIRFIYRNTHNDYDWDTNKLMWVKYFEVSVDEWNKLKINN